MTLLLNSWRKIFYSAVLLMLFFLLTTIFLNLYQDLSGLEKNEHQERKASFDLTMQQITAYIELTRAKVKVVAYQEGEILHHLLHQPTDLDKESHLQEVVEEYLPEVFAISMADPNGNVIMDDFDGKIGDACRQNIKTFSHKGGEYRLKVHPNPIGYHFDIMMPFVDHEDNKKGTFLVSFRFNTLADILRENALSEHQLFLLDKASKRIEVSRDGARNDMTRDFQLSKAELARLGPLQEVPGTDWLLVNLPPENYLGDRLQKIILAHTGYLLLVLMLTAFLVLAFLREKRHQHELEAQVFERTRELENAHKQTNSLVENASDGIINIDAQQNIILFNPAAEKIFQYSREEVLGKPLTILLPADAQKHHHHHVKEFNQDKSNHAKLMDSRAEVKGKRKDGSLFMAEASICKSYIDNEVFFTAFVRDITKRIEAEEQVRRLAMTDSLTGLANRHHFETKLTESMTYLQRYPGHEISLLLLDLDRFKPVNDTFGHAVGDQLLQRVSRIMLDNIRETDVVGRLGGDEFAILLQGVENVEQAETVAEKLIQIISKAHVIDEHQVEIGVSIGVTFYPACAGDSEELFQQADKMLYAAKSAGRNTYRVYTCS